MVSTQSTWGSQNPYTLHLLHQTLSLFQKPPETLAKSLASSMEFWGVEVKAGETLRVDPGVGKLLHLSQAALGESKKDKGEPVVLNLKFNTQKLVLGTLSSDKCPNLAFDLVFEQEFELSHNWKNGSIYLAGYKNSNEEEEGYEGFSGSSDESESDEELPVAATENGKPEVQAAKAKPTAAKEAAAKPESAKKVKVVEPSKDEEDSDEDDDDIDSDEDMGDGSDSDDSDEDDEDDESDEEEETPTPKKAVGNKKRQAESATKTPVSTKKAKVASPADGKKGGHSATPHPAKKAVAKTSNADKSKSSKSGGEVTCKSCSKSFKSEQAMEAHSKAKHSSGK